MSTMHNNKCYRTLQLLPFFLQFQISNYFRFNSLHWSFVHTLPDIAFALDDTDTG